MVKRKEENELKFSSGLGVKNQRNLTQKHHHLALKIEKGHVAQLVRARHS